MALRLPLAVFFSVTAHVCAMLLSHAAFPDESGKTLSLIYITSKCLKVSVKIAIVVKQSLLYAL